METSAPVSTDIVPAPAAAYAPTTYRGFAQAPHNVLAWVSLGLALGFVVFGVLTSSAAIVCGHLARAQIRRTGEQGSAAALTGLILGYVFTALGLLAIVLGALFFIGLFGLAVAFGAA